LVLLQCAECGVGRLPARAAKTQIFGECFLGLKKDFKVFVYEEEQTRNYYTQRTNMSRTMYYYSPTLKFA